MKTTTMTLNLGATFVDPDSKVSLLNMFYPVGAIFLTLDSTFDPNATWGGYGKNCQG